MCTMQVMKSSAGLFTTILVWSKQYRACSELETFRVFINKTGLKDMSIVTENLCSKHCSHRKLNLNISSTHPFPFLEAFL